MVTMKDPGYAQQFLHTPNTAGIPKRIRRGVFANVLLVQQVNGEFILDFLTTLIHPQELVRRVVCSQHGLSKIIASLEVSLSEYETRFGPIRSIESMRVKAEEALPNYVDFAAERDNCEGRDQAAERMDMAQVYKSLKLLDDRLVGVYADSLAARFTSLEVCLDFIANFYPRSVVVARVLVAASRIPPLLETLLKARDLH